MEDAEEKGGGVEEVCEADVVSVVRKRVEATKEGRKKSRLEAAVAVRIGIWRSIVGVVSDSPQLEGRHMFLGALPSSRMYGRSFGGRHQKIAAGGRQRRPGTDFIAPRPGSLHWPGSAD